MLDGVNEINIEFGVGTLYEAHCHLDDSLDRTWTGHFVYMDTRLSPLDTEALDPRALVGYSPNHLQVLFGLKYFTPSAASGALAHARAENHWKAISAVLESLL